MFKKQACRTIISDLQTHPYTDDKEGWLSALDKHTERQSAHDLLHQGDDNHAAIAARLLETAKPLQETGLGRALLNSARMGNGRSMAAFIIAAGKKYPQPHVALPLFDSNGRAAGVYLDELRHQDSGRGAWLNHEPRILGGEDARFAGLQESQNGEVRIAASVLQGFELAAAYPDSGVIIRLHGDGVPFNVSRITGEQVVDDRHLQQGSSGESSGATTPVVYPFILTEQEKRAKAQAQALHNAAEKEESVQKMLAQKDEATAEVLAQSPDSEDRLSDERLKAMGRAPGDEQATEKALRDIVASDALSERMARMEREIVKEKVLGE